MGIIYTEGCRVPMSRFRIVSKRQLAPTVTLVEVTAPRIARKAAAGQFVVIRVDEHGERVPLTIADKNPEAGTITMVFQWAGYTTRQLGAREVGDTLADVLGPLGQPTHVEKYGRVVCVAGGVGIAFLYPQVKAFAEAGNEIVSILAARSADLLFFVDEIRQLSAQLHIATDDGSLGHHGLVTDVLRSLLEAGQHFDHCIAIGPLPMMRATVALTKEYGLPTLVSLDPIMVDGTGMCGACRVTVGGEVKFACVDGPDFDGHQVDFEELAKRKRAFAHEEKECLMRLEADRLAAERDAQ
jgi:ferredoxin--NADP+ reductase